MIYNASNVPVGTTVYNVDTKEKVMRVMSIDTDRNVVVCVSDPCEIAADGTLATYEIKFRSIYPIYGGRFLPDLFHCYGLLQ